MTKLETLKVPDSALYIAEEDHPYLRELLLGNSATNLVRGIGLGTANAQIEEPKFAHHQLLR